MEESKLKKQRMKENYFVCLTPLHFYVSYYIAKRAYDEKGSYSVIFVKGNFNYKNQPLGNFIELVNIKNGTFFEKVICKIKYTLFWRMTSLYRRMRRDMKELYVFNFNDPLTKHIIQYADNTAKITYVEEGIGSWSHTWDGGHVPESVGYVLVGEPEMFVNIHPDFHGEIIKFNYKDLFNKKTAREFCALLIKHTEKWEIDYLYLGIPDEGVIDTKCEMEVLKKIIEYIPEGKKIYIKKHPRDVSKKYEDLTCVYNNVKIMDKELNKIPMECLVWVCSIDTVISIISSAGVYIPYIKSEIKSIFLYRIEPILNAILYSGGYSRGEMDSFNNFIGVKESIYRPKDLHELKQCLCEL